MTSWVVDAMYGEGGYQAIRPDRIPWHEENGYDHNDFEAVFGIARCVDGFSKAYAQVAGQLEREAAEAGRAGHVKTATRLYLRAALLYGRGQYHLFADSPLKTAIYERSRSCYQQVVDASKGRMERVEIPFDGATLYAILHLPADAPRGSVVVLPGMDALKEERHVVAQELAERGYVALTLDGPGQGETLLNGLKVSIDNYERAASAAIDLLVTRFPASTAIGLIGTSMGSYWGSRCLAHDQRIRAGVVAMGCYGPMRHMFTAARPAFRDNYKYMAGIADDADFDVFVEQMDLSPLAPKIQAPYLLVHGEYDELNPLNDALAWFEKVPSPKEAWIFEDEYHPMGRRAGDFLPKAIDWLCDRLEGATVDASDLDRRLFVRSRFHGGEWKEFRQADELVLG